MPKTLGSSVTQVSDVEIPPLLEVHEHNVFNSCLQQNINRLKELHGQGYHINENIENSVEFKNPYLLEASVFSIDEYSTNLAKQVYDPDYYVQLVNEPDTTPVDSKAEVVKQPAEPDLDTKTTAGSRRRPSGWSP
ncbi:hypothetical protein BgAZ_103610 [Babesia gibsoni]|uniref:HCNGP-like protein n=1 Tax=Babesia gibsoni TaxID=33632 RepID=A0AAD8PFT8_BABGI|nr:hypothetical protein BgAZ_103610 [Babesia gibsoni]